MGKLPFSHTVIFLALLTFFALCSIEKHVERIQRAYRIGKLEKVKRELEEEKRKLEVIFARESHPEALLERAKLLGYAFVPAIQWKNPLGEAPHGEE